MAKDDNSIEGLLKKGNGLLTRYGDVWSYSGAAVDISGTNLKLPVNYITDAEVKEALASGKLSAAVTDSYGRVNAVRTVDSTEKVLTTALAGSAEMGTELAPGSRVEHDAGRKPVTAEEAEAAAAASMEAIVAPAKSVEGAEVRQPAAVVQRDPREASVKSGK